MPEPLTPNTFDTLSDWQRQGDSLEKGRLTRTFTFGNFTQAFAFMTDVAELCDTQDHHPVWSNNYNRVTIELTSHDVQRLTRRDLALAEGIDSIAERHQDAMK